MILGVALSFAGDVGAQQQEHTTSGTIVATADIEPRSGSNARGKATFSRDGKGQLVLVVEMEGLSPGARAVHLHAKGDCSAPDGSSAGDHWNPTRSQHGKWDAPAGYHLGDVGNINVAPDGTGTISLTTTKWTAGTGAANDVVGKSIVVHSGTDDFESQPAGNSGPRVGCGVIIRR